MKFCDIYSDILVESPLPDDWDSTIFNQNVPFKTRIEYAKERAEYIASGSSRTAFMIPYKGRKTILKIAKNMRGGAQSAKEVQLLNDHYLVNRLKMAIPIIDYDEKSSFPTWIHMEFAERVKDADFVSECGVTAMYALNYAMSESGRHPDRFRHKSVKPNSKFIQTLTEYIANYDPDDHQIADMAVNSNWGKYKGNFVMVDMGIDKEVYHSHYLFRGASYARA